MKFIKIIILISLITLISSCIIIEDDWVELYERVIYRNYTPYHIENYVDGVYIGTVGPFDTYIFKDDHLEGTHEFYSEAIEEEVVWGPKTFYIEDGETIVLDMYEDGTFTESKE